MTNPRTNRRPSAVAMLAPLLLAGLLACDPAPTPGGTRPSTPASSDPTTDQQDPRAAIEIAYERYWERSQQVPHQARSTWRASMAEVATNPQLKITLHGMAFQIDTGATSYGQVRARITDVTINGSSAVVTDCQDASRSGLRDSSTGKKKTVGIPRNPVRAEMKRSAKDDQWRVSKISYPGGEC